MVLEMSKTFTHCCGNKPEQKHSEEELKNIMIKLMERNGIDPAKAKLNENGVFEIQETPNIKLHSFMLQAEELGLQMKYTKKTLIEIA